MQKPNLAIGPDFSKDPPPLAWIFWGIITSPIGLPCFFVGIIIGVESLQTVWPKLTIPLVEIFYGKSELGYSTASTPAAVEDFVQHPLDPKNLLNIARCNDGEFRRFIRHIDENGFVGPIELSIIVPGELCALGMENDLGSALRYTLRQFEQGVFKETVPWIAVSPTGQIIPATDDAQEQPPAVPLAKEDSSSHQQAPENEQKACVEQPASSRPPPKQDAPMESQRMKPNDSTANAVDKSKGDIGRVMFAEMRDYPSKGGRPAYSSFTVRLRKENGQEVAFTGVDLESKFTGTDAFKSGDRVQIVSYGKQTVDVKEDGQWKKSHRNCYGVFPA